MYHRPQLFSHIFNSLLVLFLILLLSGQASEAFETLSVDAITEMHESTSGAPLPKGNFYKHRPLHAAIYQYDKEPLGKRAPLLIVHGLRAEYFPAFRWEKLIKRLKANTEFTNKFKIYLARYDSTAPMSVTVPQMQNKIAELYESTGKKQIVALALSIGGNLMYESMLKPETDKQIKLLMAMGTPFHGSPLFSGNWLQYGLYKNCSLPWMRLDRSIAYRLYFADNPNLLLDFSWDNCDQAIPIVGAFASKLPLGPKGFLEPQEAVNNRLVAINKMNFDKSKLITYSGYVVNPYQLAEAARFIEITFFAPYTLFTIILPAHLAREHAVLKMLNRVIATVIPTEEAEKRAKTKFVYVLNDGITPLISSMFLADKYCAQIALSREIDIAQVRPLVDVRTARIFRNLDHLTFMDGSRPGSILRSMRDELNPAAGSRDIFSWILHDLDCAAAGEDVPPGRDT